MHGKVRDIYCIVRPCASIAWARDGNRLRGDEIRKIVRRWRLPRDGINENMID
jgi:hypothetical protein